MGPGWGLALDDFLLLNAAEGSIVADTALRAGEFAGRAIDMAGSIVRAGSQAVREVAGAAAEGAEVFVMSGRGAMKAVEIMTGRNPS